MKYGYKEVKKVNAMDLRKLCIKYSWYTSGTNEEYDQLLKYGFEHKEITTDDIVEMATLIMEHSSNINEEITTIMYLINEVCYSYFEEIE